MQTQLLFLGNLGGPEIFLIIAVVLIFFGAKKIPELARGLGRGIREFKDATREISDELDESANDRPKNKSNNAPVANNSTAPVNQAPVSNTNASATNNQ